VQDPEPDLPRALEAVSHGLIPELWLAVLKLLPAADLLNALLALLLAKARPVDDVARDVGNSLWEVLAFHFTDLHCRLDSAQVASLANKTGESKGAALVRCLRTVSSALPELDLVSPNNVVHAARLCLGRIVQLRAMHTQRPLAPSTNAARTDEKPRWRIRILAPVLSVLFPHWAWFALYERFFDPSNRRKGVREDYLDRSIVSSHMFRSSDSPSSSSPTDVPRRVFGRDWSHGAYLAAACLLGSSRLVASLLPAAAARGIHCLEESCLNAWRPLAWAAYSGNFDLVNLLLDYELAAHRDSTSAQIRDIIVHHLSEALEASCDAGDVEMACLLIARGAAAGAPGFCFFRTRSQGFASEACEHYTRMLPSLNALDVACLAGDIAMVKLLLESGVVTVSGQEHKEASPLVPACRAGHLNLAKYLIETWHARLDAVAFLGRDGRFNIQHHERPLDAACESGNVELVALLVDCAGVNVTVPPELLPSQLVWTPRPPIFCAIGDPSSTVPSRCRLEIVKLFISRGMESPADLPEFWKSLSGRLQPDMCDVAEYLCSIPGWWPRSGTDLGEPAEQSLAAQCLLISCRIGALSMIRFWLGRLELENTLSTVMNPTLRSGNRDTQAPLHALLEYRNSMDLRFNASKSNFRNWRVVTPESVQLLISKGADVLAKDVKGKTPLYKLCELEEGLVPLETVQLLFSPAVAHEPWERKDTPLRCAVRAGNAQMLRWLTQEFDVELNHPGEAHHLHQATADRSLRMVRALLECKADSTAFDNKGWTALHYAVVAHGLTSWNVDLVEALILAGAVVNAKATKPTVNLNPEDSSDDHPSDTSDSSLLLSGTGLEMLIHEICHLQDADSARRRNSWVYLEDRGDRERIRNTISILLKHGATPARISRQIKLETLHGDEELYGVVSQACVVSDSDS
jgi:ankyrin repeat protein